MYNSSSSPKIRNSVIWGNTAATGNGIYTDSGTPEVNYSIVQDGGYPASNPVSNTNYNLNADPLFVSPQNASAAPTTEGEYRLQSGSPAVNAGNNTYYDSNQTPDLSAITTDLGGTARVKGGTIDMGAYEKE
jgi:hypothetical protein